jgi:hypothetical protein
MNERPTAVLALTPIAEREVESLLFDAGEAQAPITLLGSPAEADALLRVVEEKRPNAVLLSAALSGLTPGHCERLRAAGARLVGLALDQRDREALRALTVDALIDPTVSREELLAAVCGGDAARTMPLPAVASETTRATRAARAEDSGSVLAVVGGKGAPGASECAASVAWLACQQWPTVLVEIDALGGGLDVRLGADPTNGSLFGLVRAAAGGGAVQRELVERWLTDAEGWPPVLLGPPEPDTLAELAEPGTMAHALRELASLFALTVCDVGALLGHAGQLFSEARLHRETLVAADAVLLVLGARDIQLRHGLRQLDLLLGTLGVPPERLRIVANAIGGPGSANRAAITQTITGHLAQRGVTVDAWLPWDERALKNAQRRGVPLSARKRSGYTRAIDGLLRELFLPTAQAPTPKRRKRRIAAPNPRQAPEEEVVWQR